MPPRSRLDEDVKPLSEFRANVFTLVRKVRRTRRPLVLTQRGRSAAVLLDVSEYEQLLEEIEILRDIQVAEKQLAEGRGIPHAQARKRILAALRK